MMAMMVKVVTMVVMPMVMSIVVAMVMVGMVVVNIICCLLVRLWRDIFTCDHFDFGFFFVSFPFVSLLWNDHGEGAMSAEEEEEERGQKTVHLGKLYSAASRSLAPRKR